MIKASINLQDLRRKIYIKAKTEKTCRDNAKVLAGTDGVRTLYIKGLAYMPITK